MSQAASAAVVAAASTPLSPAGAVDGYGRMIAVFSFDSGELLHWFGSPGNAPGQISGQPVGIRFMYNKVGSSGVSAVCHR